MRITAKDAFLKGLVVCDGRVYESRDGSLCHVSANGGWVTLSAEDMVDVSPRAAQCYPLELESERQKRLAHYDALFAFLK